ncbi:zinc metalloprotease ZmpB-like isoform X4 [Centruroides vittatus]|uniref:zinc metalloprotease ZmpB-like isoform X4 n=1 Tax=Centruroides vittatus TaxID=120091 RepID=UPI0035102BCD
MRRALLPILLFSLEGVFCGYSTGFRKTPAPQDDKVVINPVLYPSPHPKQRFIGHHEGWIKNADVDGGAEVPDISKPEVEGIPVVPPKGEIWDKDTSSINVEPHIYPPKDVLINPSTDFIVEEHKDKHPEQIDTVKDIRVDHPKDVPIHEEPKIIVDPPKEVCIEDKPVVINPPKTVHIEDKPIVDHPKEDQYEQKPTIVIDRKPEIIVDPPKEVYIEDKPVIINPPKTVHIEDKPIVDHPKEDQYEQKPTIVIDRKPEIIVDPPKEVYIEDKPIVDHPKEYPSTDFIEQRPTINDKPEVIVHIQDKPVVIVDPLKDVQVEENPIPIGPYEPDQDQIRVLPEIPYPVKVTNENSNLNLYEMLQKLQLSRFVHLIEEAGLQELLSGEEPITIFAPSDYALSKLKADEIRRLASDRDLLRQFILYHCVDGSIFGSTLVNDPLKTKIDRNILLANYYGEKWYVNGVEIKVRDQVCKNGAIHIIDEPLYPFPVGGILETLEASGNFKIFSELLRNAKLDEVLEGESRWTIFAPTDAAFSKLPPSNVEWLKWDIPAIKNLFNKVACRGYYYTSWINSGSTSPPLSLANESMDFSGFPDSLINGISLSQRDITTDNGCIQAIDDIWFSSILTPGEASVGKKS